MTLKLRYFNDASLRQICEPVKIEDLDEIKSQINYMVNIMKFNGGIALAANQVGITKRFFIMLTDKGNELFINPEIIETSDLKPFKEGCLSIPGTSSKIMRYHLVVLKYLDEDFNEKIRTFKDINAVAIQHEIDHLNGKLYVDKLKNSQKLLLLYKSKQFLNKKNIMS